MFLNERDLQRIRRQMRKSVVDVMKERLWGRRVGDFNAYTV